MKHFKLSFFAFILVVGGCLDTGSSGYDDSEDQAYLEDYAQRSGVTTTNSGLMYRVIEEGEGESPASNQYAIIKYEGESVDQSVQYDTGNGFELVVPENLASFLGIGEGVQLMNEGARYEFVMPPELALDDGRAFIFEIQLESFIREDQEQFLVENAELDDVEVTDSGLQYRVIEEGDGEQPASVNTVRVKYTGTYTNGYVFDQTSDDETAEFTVSGVIPGFSEGLQLMKEGSIYELFLPPDLGYGASPPQYGAVIRFEVELVEVL